MANKLVIVESPAKSKTIGQYLGKDYIVKSSVGHIRDLAVTGKGGLGIDVENDFKPTYMVLPEKKKVISDLNKALKTADYVYLATDPDREGEAISWHLKETLDIKNQEVKRVVFNEITKNAIQEAFAHPGEINDNLVSSQETRRILDRIIGFKLSTLLQSKIKSKSAGRVQSAALKLIVDKEKEIEAFKIEEYYEIYAKFGDLETKLSKLNNKTPKIPTAEKADEILKSLDKDFIVKSIEKRNAFSNSKPPFITSTLQQMASNKYGYSPTRTMKAAQQLYEGIDIGNETVGLITYMRTDSVRLSDSFVEEARHYITEKYGANYFSHYRKSNTGNTVQDAHEAIRPTSVLRNPKSIKQYLSDIEYKLYTLIYIRAVSSLMKSAKNEITTLLLENNQAIFKITSTTQLFDGYMKLYSKIDNTNGVNHFDLSKFNENDKLKADEIYKKQLFTSPPARYSEARLIKEMETLGIGRPSTYAQTISTITQRKYVVFKEKKFFPTDQGRLTIEKLDKYFAEFVSANYSKSMEETLDEVANGSEQQLKILKEFYSYFIPLVDNAFKKMEKIKPKETGELCPQCGSPMVFRTGRYGQFEACSNYPKCKYIKKQEKEETKEAYDTKVECPECHQGTLLLRTAKKGKNKGNKFLACSRFPKCRYISPLQVLDEKCPDCGNIMVKDKDGKEFCLDKHNCDE